MTCSNTKLGSKLDQIKQLLIENGQKKTLGSEKCPVYLKLPRIGNVSSKFENQISKAITSCYYAVKPRVVYNTSYATIC